MAIQIGFKKGRKQTNIRFKSSFDEWTLGNFAKFMLLEKQIVELTKKAEETNTLLEALNGTGASLDAVLEVDAELIDTDAKIRQAKVKQLAHMAVKPESTFEFLYDTSGITYDHIGKAFIAVELELGSFDEWFAGIIPKKTVTIKRRGFRHKSFSVFDMDKTTVLRDTVVAQTANKLHRQGNQLLENDWTQFSKFLAYLLRPTKQKLELTALKKKRKQAFLYDDQLGHLAPADKLEAYNDELDKQAADREKLFLKMPLRDALAVYKQYFFFKSELMKGFSSLYPKKEQQDLTLESLKYANTFGIETSIEDLRVVSGYEADAIWLFSVAVFNKELLKYNLKLKAEQAERKKAIELAERKAKAEKMNKKN